MDYTKEMADKFMAAARRKAALKKKLPVFKNRTHRDKKNDYNRREAKKIIFDPSSDIDEYLGLSSLIDFEDEIVF